MGLANHYDDSRFQPGGNNDLRVATYDGPTAEQRRPGASGVSYWSESISHAVPESESVYLKTSITYRPVPTDCGAGDVDVLGIDRDNTYEGERRVDEDVADSIKSLSKDEDARATYEREFGEFGDLTTADWDYVERLEVEWYGRDDFGPPVRIAHEDRFVSAQQDCYDNPDAAGWYRVASLGVVEFENGTTARSEEPTFSHWFFVCECEDRQAAVETLGPPPSERVEETATPTDDGDAENGATESADETGETGATPSEPTSTETADSGPEPTTPTVTSTPATTPRPTATAAGNWESEVVETPTPGAGTGFTPVAAMLALLAALAAARR